jgi:crossover junction endodeoxyribonuclease RuvC
VANRIGTTQSRQRCILGIDPGLDRTGYAVLETNPIRIVEAGVIRSDTAAALPARLVEIEAGLVDIIREHTLDLVAVETLYAHYKHPRTAILMGHARGVILLAAARAGIDVMSIPATRIKKSLTGNGHASKVQMQKAVAQALRLAEPPEPADVADALAIALCAHETRTNEAALAGGVR